ncbi:anaphase control protein cut9 [Hortaea werneckii]|nr:anaphase control protein cut9 [Hortaea werneckii]
MEAYLRRWMKDALAKHQYDSAIYVGDKLLAFTDSDSDAFNLAHAHFDAGNYTRALAFVARADLIQRSPAAKYLAAHCYVQQGRHEDALALLGDKNPTHLITTTDSARRKLQHLHATNGASKSHSSKAKGAAGRLDRADRSEERDLGRREDLKYEAGMCYLRGLCHAKQNAFDRAKECYKDAVRIDVQCFEAFDQLMKNSLMSPGEEWAFVDSLDFESIHVPPPQTLEEEKHPLGEGRPTATTTAITSSSSSAEAADFTRNLYLTRLSKYSRPEEFTTAIETLSTHYALSHNPDILLAKAELLSTTSQYTRALSLTTQILSRDPYNFPTIPLHLSLLYQQNHTTTLFALAHDLAETHPSEPTTWLAVGTYYLLTSRIPEARSYFSKASLMNPSFGAAWIGFAHTFAAEGESDQAIAAYSTAARLFQGTHLPQLFLGMQELALENLVVAREYLTSAWKVCDRDPTLVNEMGVCWFKEGEFGAAVRSFELGLRILEEDGAGNGAGGDDGAAAVAGNTGVGVGGDRGMDTQTPTLRLNLAHALRKLGRFRESLEQFDEVIRLGSLALSSSSSTTFSTNPSASSASSSNGNKELCPLFTAKGLVLLELEDYFEATLAFHAALAISPQDPLASELLARALGELEGSGVLGREEEEKVDEELRRRLGGVRALRARQGAGGRRRRGRGDDADDGMDLDGTVAVATAAMAAADAGES